ncbi:MAG: hypothetical protein J5601_01960, partial [Elusimicrobiaceae bacterium]|nr:hypothetical protein [Elusimicrobiaceae bacterium]
MKRPHGLLVAGMLFAGLLFPVGPLHAQLSPRFSYNAMKAVLSQQQKQLVETAWLHGINLPIFHNTLEQSSFFAIRDGSLLLQTAKTSLTPPTFTHPGKWIFSNVSFHNVFSKPEKTLLLHESAPRVKLGQIAFLHDRHAALFMQANDTQLLTDRDVLTFNEHQKRLQNLFSGLDFYYRQNMPEEFATALFPKDKIPQITTQPFQSNALTFSEKERSEFAALPDISAQQTWAQQHLQAVYQDLGRMQEAGKTNLGDVPFEHYYMQKMRYDYLQLLKHTLQQSTQKRTSLILRPRQPLAELGGIPVTDAERLGYARFQADTNPTETTLNEYNRLYDQYASYAAAEIFGTPYELPLRRGANSIFLLSEEESTRLSGLSYSQLQQELPAKIANLQARLAQLHTQPVQTPAFYKQYYRIAAEADIYRSLLKR